MNTSVQSYKQQDSASVTPRFDFSRSSFKSQNFPFELLKYTMNFLNLSELNALGHASQAYFKEMFVNRNIVSPWLDRKTSRFISALAHARLNYCGNTPNYPISIHQIEDIESEAKFWGLQEVPPNKLGYKILPSHIRHLIIFRAIDFAKLGNFTELLTICISEKNSLNHTIADAQLSQITFFAKTLQTLSIFYLPLITDTGLQALTHFTALKELYLEAPKVTTVGLGALSNLTSLKFLDINRLTITDFAFLQKLTSLQSLIFTSCKTISIINIAQNIPATLRHLKFSYCEEIEENGLGELSNLSQLKIELYEHNLYLKARKRQKCVWAQ